MLSPNYSFAETNVLGAVYGTNGSWKDVSKLLESQIALGTKEVMIGNHTMGGDPAPGKVKTLKLVLRDATGVREVEIQEGESLKFPFAFSNIELATDTRNLSPGNQAQQAGNAQEVKAKAAQETADTNLTPEELSSLVTISNNESGGTGFICTINGKNLIITNQHVISGMHNARYQTHGGSLLVPGALQVAADADLAIMALTSLPPGVRPLELLDGLAIKAKAGDAVTIPGNSNADGVITQTHGKLLAIGGQRVETDCPVYRGNSGSPIIHRKTGKVIGVLTKYETLELDEFTKASFRDKKSAIKSEFRYIGYRPDTVTAWRPITASAMNTEARTIDQSRLELNYLWDYFTGASDSYKEYEDLHLARNEAAKAFNRKNLAFSDVERAQQRFMWKIEGLIERASKRLPKMPLVFVHKEKIEHAQQLANALKNGLAVVERDDELMTELIKSGD